MTSPYVPAAQRYDTMPYRRAGRSGLVLPAVSLGLWQNFGAEQPAQVQRDVVLRAVDLGVTHLDLANNYGPPHGSAEQNLGRILATDLAPFRDELVISTKAGYGMWPGPYGDGGSRKYLLTSLEQSMRRLGVDYVDVFYSHRPDPSTPIAETMGALHSVVQQGKALYVGLSNYSPSQTREAVAVLAELGTPVVLHQPSYSMFNRHIELVGAGEQETLLDVVDDLGIGTIVFSPLSQGLLTNRYLDGSAPAGSRASRPSSLSGSAITEVYLERVRGLGEIAAARGQSIAQLALTWVLRDPRVTSAVIGASSVAQLEDSVAAAWAVPLTDAEIAAIEPLAVDGTGR